jgi:hypothetical protein
VFSDLRHHRLENAGWGSFGESDGPQAVVDLFVQRELGGNNGIGGFWDAAGKEVVTFSWVEVFVAENVGPHVPGVPGECGFHPRVRTFVREGQRGAGERGMRDRSVQRRKRFTDGLYGASHGIRQFCAWIEQIAMLFM